MVGAHGRRDGLAVADAGLLRGSDLLDRSKLLLPRLAPPTTAAPVPAAAPLAARPSVALERVIAPPPERFDGPAAPKAPPPARLFAPPTNAGAGGTWAVMIGINNYPGTKSDLSAAVNDATDVNEALARLGVPGSNRLLIRDGQASAEVIRASVNWLNERAGPDATAIFFFAGHVRKVGDGRESLVAADGGTVSDGDLASRLRSLRAGRVWIGIAACYGGGFNEVLQPGRILTGAAPANSLAYENGGFQRSYMVQYMIREALIEGRAGSTTIEGAFAYAQAALARDYPNRQPVQFDHAAGELELRQPGSQSAPPPPPPSQPPPSGDGGGSGGSSGGSGGQEPGKEPEENNCEWSFGIVSC
jgi:hypothetical protein